MRIIREPKVYLIAHTGLDLIDEWTRFSKDEGLETPELDTFKMTRRARHPELLIEIAGRLCYMSYGKGRKTNEEFIRNLIDSGHHSVLEHANWSFLITGVSRSLSHEFVRHRHFSYSQLSQRYVDSSDVAFVMPDEIAQSPQAARAWQDVMEMALHAYKVIEDFVGLKYDLLSGPKTLKTKLARQAARSVLPNCTETKMVVTGNARAWRGFFNKRGTIHADVEIRRLACVILNVLKSEAPTIFADYHITPEGTIECRIPSPSVSK